MSDYLEAVGPVRIEPFDYGDAPDWLTLDFDESIDSDGEAWDHEQFTHTIQQTALLSDEFAEALLAFGSALADAVTNMLIHGEAFIEVDSPDETGGMTIDELIPGIDEQLAEWRKVRDE